MAPASVLRVLSEAFEQAAKQFTSDAKNSIAKQIATKFLNFWNQSLAEFDEPPKPTYAIRTHVAARVGIDLRRVPAAFPVNTGWAIQASDKVTRDMLVQRQSDWALELTDLRGIEINYDVAVREEIVCQTGLEPLSGQNTLFHFQTALLSDIGF
ncbi:endonuclease/exonuclease/phosphatase [Hirsutella rhossiliensis]